MASIYTRRDSPYIWIKYREKGLRIVQRSTGFRKDVGGDLRKARALEAEKTAEELRSGIARPASIGDWNWVRDFLRAQRAPGPTLGIYLRYWGMFELFFAERKIIGPAALTRAHCFEYIDWRIKPREGIGKYKASHNTALIEVKLLAMVMQEAVIRGIVNGNPCSHLGIRKRPTKVKPAFTEADCATIRKAIAEEQDEGFREMMFYSFEIARHQGCRLMETRVRLCDVDLAAGIITFPSPKGGANRAFTTALHPALVPIFEEMERKGKTITWDTPAGKAASWAQAKWFHTFRKTGLAAKGLTFHSLRVTVITELARNNVSLSKAQFFVNHASSAIHKIYQRLKPDDLSECVSAVGKRPSSSNQD